MQGHSGQTVGVLVICTANRCRSVMAGAFLARRLAGAGQPGWVRSAGVVPGKQPPLSEVVSVMASYGLDVSEHRARPITVADLDRAHLVLGMTREHVRHGVVMSPSAWARAFTLEEFVRRAGDVGPRLRREPFAAWLARVHDGRDRKALLGDSPADDVADPDRWIATGLPAGGC